MILDVIRLDRHCGGIVKPLQDAIGPWAAQHALACSLRTHWAGGHHLAIRFRHKQGSAPAPEVSAFADELRRWADANPSPHQPDPAEYQSLSIRLGHAEGIPAHAIPELAQNDAIAVSQQVEPPYLGSDAIADIRIAFEERALPALIAMSGGSMTDARTACRLQLALVQIAHAYRAGGACNGYRSVRAHAGNFLVGNPEMTPRFEALYAGSRAWLLPRIEAVLRGDRGAAGCDDTFAAAIDGVGADLDALWQHAPDEVINAGVHGFQRESGGETLPAGIAKWLAPEIAFGSREARRALGRHRALINIVYAQCPILGISALTRFACAYVAFRGLADVLALDADIAPLARSES